MSDIERAIKHIRPRLRDVAPQTFWFSIGFGTFNVLVGLFLYNLTILVTLKLVGVIPLKMWAVIFVSHGLVMLCAIAVNNWKVTRTLHMAGIVITTAWWLELVATTFSGRSPFLLIVWTLLLFLQVVVWIYFTPRIDNVQ